MMLWKDRVNVRLTAWWLINVTQARVMFGRLPGLQPLLFLWLKAIISTQGGCVEVR